MVYHANSSFDAHSIDEKTKAIVVGTGVSGRAAVKLLKHFNAHVRLLDSNPNAYENLTDEFKAYLKENSVELICGEHKKEDFEDYHILVPSPGASIHNLIPLLSEDHPPLIMAETELASLYICDEKILAITGTSGKTTTTSLASCMLKEHGYKVFTGGNIGIPLSEYILARENGEEKVDIILLELSSFQLQTCHSLKPNVALFLNISENHLDYHKDMQEYFQAKMRIFQCQTEEDYAIFGEELMTIENSFETYPLRAKRVFFKVDENSFRKFSKSNLFGAHNIINAEAAYQATTLFGVTLEEAQKALAEFQPIEHRLENSGEVNGILFVNDSKGTTVESLKVALKAFENPPRPILLLVGGKFKGGDLESLIPIIKERVKSIIMFGDSREYFEKAWNGIVPMAYHEKLSDAMQAHFEDAQANDVILLSPATASFDQYKNYLQRGDDFKQIAKNIIESNK